ncbi:MAG: hypothetical protein FWF54_06205 [Candidatus Azobacteroides sp.]|nr:hypothetical protein [Candidatus Azobacteroides sp.]
MKFHKTEYNTLNLFLFLIFIGSGFLLSAKNKENNPLQHELSYDSIIHLLNDKGVSLDQKYHLTCQTQYFSYEQKIDIFKHILDEGKTRLDNNKLVRLYSTLSMYYSCLWDSDKAGQMLITASSFADKAYDPEALGLYYYAWGNYYNDNVNEQEAHAYFYKAMPYFEQTEALKDRLIPLYFSLAFSYSARRDVENLKKIIDKMLPQALKSNQPDDLINTYSITSNYYSFLSDKDKTKTVFLDSAIIYNNKAIQVFNSIKNPSNLFKYSVAYNYRSWADYNMELPDWNADSVFYYLEKTKEFANPADTFIQMSYHWLKGNALFKKGKLKEARKEYNIQLSLMESCTTTVDYSRYANLYEMLAKEYEAEGNYQRALECERLRSEYKDKLYNKDRYTIIQDLQTKYETEKKEQDIRRLKQETQYQRKINILIAGVCILIIFASVLVLHWMRLKRKSIADRLQIAEMEKEKAELRNKLQEEELIRIELEKYEALLEVHFKDRQIKGKKDELNALMEEKEQLLKQLNEYSDRVKKYDLSFLVKQPNIEPDYHSVENIVEKITSLITSKLESNPYRQQYLHNLSKIGDMFLKRFEKEYVKGNLPLIYIKYCVCFVIGMDTASIARCFAVELASVRQARHRIKVRLGLEKEDDLDSYLRNLIK